MKPIADQHFLYIDASTPVLSCAVSCGDAVFELSNDMPRQHGHHALPLVDELLKLSGQSHQDLTAVAVSVGPGSFIGVRIAVGVASTLAYGWGKPMLSFSALQLLAQTALMHHQLDHVQVVMDARKNETYVASYEEKDGVMVCTVAPALCSISNLTLAPTVVVSGDLNIDAPTVLSLAPSAKAGITLANHAYEAGKTHSPMDLNLLYLRNKVTD